MHKDLMRIVDEKYLEIEYNNQKGVALFRHSQQFPLNFPFLLMRFKRHTKKACDVITSSNEKFVHVLQVNVFRL